MEKLCRLKPLHSGLSPAVLRDLQWPEISEAAHCQCWRTLLTELKPGQRAMLYNAMQEVMVLSSNFSYLVIPPHTLLQLTRLIKWFWQMKRFDTILFTPEASSLLENISFKQRNCSLSYIYLRFPDSVPFDPHFNLTCVF